MENIIIKRSIEWGHPFIAVAISKIISVDILRPWFIIVSGIAKIIYLLPLNF